MALTLDADGLQQMGEQLRKDALQNFDRSGIQNRSGTLRRAVETAQITVATAAAGFTVTVELADLTRPGRGGETTPPSTRIYGPQVFGLTASRVPLAFQGRPSLRVTRLSLSSGNRQVFTLTADQIQEATETATGLLVAAVETTLNRLGQ